MLWLQRPGAYVRVVTSRRPTDDDFRAQLDAIDELAAIDNRLRWLGVQHVERFLAGKRRAELIRRIEAWNRQFASADTRKRMERGA